MGNAGRNRTASAQRQRAEYWGARCADGAIHRDTEEDTMKAEVGDRIVVASGTLHRPIRDGEILQTGAGGGGPYLVRWSDSGNESLFFPGPDAHVEHVERDADDTGDQQVAAGSRA